MSATHTIPRASRARAKPNRRGRSALARGQLGKSASGNGRAPGKRQKLNRRDIEEFLANKAGIPEEAAQALWRLLLSRIRRALVRGSPVALTNIGTLEPFIRKPTQYRHPATGEIETAPRRRHVRFVLSPSLVDDLRRVKAR